MLVVLKKCTNVPRSKKVKQKRNDQKQKHK